MQKYTIETRANEDSAILRKKNQAHVQCNLQTLNLIKIFQNCKSMKQIIHSNKAEVERVAHQNNLLMISWIKPYTVTQIKLLVIKQYYKILAWKYSIVVTIEAFY